MSTQAADAVSEKDVVKEKLKSELAAQLEVHPIKTDGENGVKSIPPESVNAIAVGVVQTVMQPAPLTTSKAEAMTPKAEPKSERPAVTPKAEPKSEQPAVSEPKAEQPAVTPKAEPKSEQPAVTPKAEQPAVTPKAEPKSEHRR